jgi:hypothetical protein
MLLFREGSYSNRWNAPASPGPSSSTAAASRAGPSDSRAGTATPSRSGTADSAGHDLSEFGDMGAAARSYTGGGEKSGGGSGGRVVPPESIPRLQDRNPYRLKHGLVVFDRSAHFSGEKEK